MIPNVIEEKNYCYRKVLFDMGKFYNEKSLQWKKSTKIIKNTILWMYVCKKGVYVC